MIPRICLQNDIHSSMAVPCSVERLKETMHSDRVVSICDSIKVLQNGEEYDKDLINGYKQNLPAITPHASRFEDNKRKNSGAVPSGLVMLDIDHVENPLEWWQNYCPDESKFKKAGIYLVAITPSGRGLRMIGERLEGESLPAGQKRLADFFGFKDYDTCTKDLARLSFLMSWNYVLYFDESGFEWKSEKEAERWQKMRAVQSEMSLEPAVVNEDSEKATDKAASQKDYPLDYEGLPYSRIAKELIILHGGEPSVGERNNVFFSLAIDMRYICDFDADFLRVVMPTFGLPLQEREQAIKSALSRPRRNNKPELLERALISVKQQIDEEEGKTLTERPKADILPIPRLPRLLQVICRNLPESYRAAMIIASLPVLGALATRVRFKYLDGQTHSFSFMSCITAPAATGKSFLRYPIDLLLTPINEQDAIERAKDQKYKEDLRKCRNSKQQPEDPHACPRNNGINVSVAALLKLMTYSGGKHLIAIGEEIDTLVKSERAGVWSQKSDIYRLAFDNSYYGQQYISDNSFSAHVPVYYNLLVTGTPGGMYRFFKDVENGLVTRVAFATLPDMFATSIPKFSKFTEAEQNFIISCARQLDASDGEIECDKVSAALSDWQEDKRRFAELSDSRAVDIIRRRAGVIGFRAGMLAYLLSDKKQAKQSAEFGVYIAEYVYRQQLSLFGDQFEKTAQEQVMRSESRGSVRNLLELLPTEFTVSDLIALRRKNGQSTAVTVVLHRWVKSGLIRKEKDKHYVKI